MSPLPPNHRFWLPATLWAVSVAGAIWAFPAEPAILAWLSFTTVGGLVAWLRPSHPVGWLLLVDGLVWIGGASTARYVADSPDEFAAAMAAAWFDQAGWIFAVGIIPLALLLFPTGRFHGRLWRVFAALIVIGGTALAVANLLTPGALPSWPEITNPFGIVALAEIAPTVSAAAEIVFFLGVLGGVASVIVRYVKATGVERQQLRWLAFAAALMLLGLAVGDVLTILGVPGEAWFNTVPMLAVPLAVGVALLRYRLWDLDLVIGRTLAYALIVLVIVGIYVLVVAGFGAMVGGGTDSNLWLAVLATAVAATLFQPLREGAIAVVRRFLFQPHHDGDTTPISVRTLGGFRVEVAGNPVTVSQWRSRKARQLLKMLVAQRGRPVHRERLIEALWPDDTEGNLGNRLSVAASTIRGVLDPGKTKPSDHYIRSDGETLQIDLGHVRVDVEEFLALATRGLAGNQSDLAAAESLYRGDFLEEDLYEEWAQPLREQARNMILAVLRQRAEIEQENSVDRGIAAYLKILEFDPWNEPAHLAVVAALQSVGRHGEARRAHRRYEARMAEIEVTPSST